MSFLHKRMINNPAENIKNMNRQGTENTHGISVFVKVFNLIHYRAMQIESLKNGNSSELPFFTHHIGKISKVW